MSEKLIIPQAIAVEGKYDKIRVSSVADALILPLDGFGVFREKEKQAYLRRLAKERGLLILTDADGGGLVIRNFLRSLLGGEGVTHLYIPPVPGKEKRKKAPSKEGLLGVEGIGCETLRAILAPFAVDAPPVARTPLTRADLYELGLSGGEGSAEKRKKLCLALGFPTNLSSKALAEALSVLCTREELISALERINANEKTVDEIP